MINEAATAVLRRTGWLAGTPGQFQDVVIARSDLVSLSAGMYIYHAGDEPGGIYALIDGHVELHLPGQGDDPTLAHIAGPGFWLGALAALINRPRRFSMRCRTACRLLRLSRAEMQRLCDEEPGYWREFAYLVAQDVGLAVGVVEMLRRSDPTSRVAMALLILSRNDMSPETGLDVSQADLAAFSRLSRSSVNAALADLERRAVIARGYRRIRITNRPLLAKWVGGG